MHVREYLKEKRLLTDGAMGTYYTALKEDDTAVSEWANLEDPKTIENIHREYIRAGAVLIRTNTFAANTPMLKKTGGQKKDRMSYIGQVIRQGVNIARDAAGKEGKRIGEDLFIAGSIGPISQFQDGEETDVLEEYKRICDIFIEEDVSAVFFETFADLHYIREAAGYIKEKKDIFVMVNFCLNKNGYSAMGISAGRLLSAAGEIEELDGCGFNCGIGPGHMNSILQKLHLPDHKYIAAMPNAGYPEHLSRRMVFTDNTSYFAQNMKEIAELGISVIGGCCGTTPSYTGRLAGGIPGTACIHAAGIEEDRLEKPVAPPIRPNEFFQKLKEGKRVIAVELDPPFDASYEKLMEQAHVLKEAGADMITMADSPMGRSRVDSVLMSVKLRQDAEVPVMPHVCCRDKNMIAMRSTLLGAYINGIRNLLVVTGDPVPSVSRMTATSVFDYNSIQLMEFIKEMNREHFEEEPFYYGGALNYGRGRLDKIADRMKRKMEAGASYFLTQPVYSEADAERIHSLRQMTGARILCGIMPLVSYRNANFVKNEISGICVPDELAARYHPDMSREEGEQTGAEAAGEIIGKLKPFADGFYFMLPFNRVSLMERIREYL